MIKVAHPAPSSQAPVDKSTLRYVPGDFRRVYMGMKMEPEGHIMFSEDGVLRSLVPRDGEWVVIDYRQYDNEQLMSYVEEIVLPQYPDEELSKYDGVDGRNVLDAQLLEHPDPSGLLPPPTSRVEKLAPIISPDDPDQLHWCSEIWCRGQNDCDRVQNTYETCVSCQFMSSRQAAYCQAGMAPDCPFRGGINRCS